MGPAGEARSNIMGHGLSIIYKLPNCQCQEVASRQENPSYCSSYSKQVP